jgi:hypothetical protein
LNETKVSPVRSRLSDRSTRGDPTRPPDLKKPTALRGAVGVCWTVGYSWPGSQTISQIWSASETQSGAAVSISNLSYDGAIPAGGSTTFGLLGTGTAPSSLSNLTCTAH